MNAQQPSGMPCHRYRPFPAVHLPDRQWPSRTITAAPRWLSTDLRDGNQALIDPMNSTRKRAMFDLVVRMGYKEIEVGFPAASQTDFDFVRELIETDRIPDDVRISVLTQAREELIERTVQSLVGAQAGQRPPLQRGRSDVPARRVRLARRRPGRMPVASPSQGTQAVVKFAETYLPDTDFGYEYSPEIFMDTEADFALDICEAVMDVWQPGPDREIIINLPCTVERSHAERLRRPDRVDVAGTCPGASTSHCPCTRTTTAAPLSPTRSWRCWPGRTGSKDACSATASGRATSTW